jgi:hypothetical protein
MTELNILGIFVATIIGMFLGAIWYSPLLFGNAWMKCIGKTPETLGKPTIPMIGSIVASFLTALGVSILFSVMSITDLSTAVSIGATLGLLIIFPALLSDNLFCGWGNKLLLIQSGYRATSVLLMSLAMYFV